MDYLYLMKDMSNPITRSDMVFYPEDAGGRLSEAWHGDKMLRDTPDHLLTANIRHRGSIYYVNELVKRTDDRWFIPKRWITCQGKMRAVGYEVLKSTVRTLPCYYGFYLKLL